MNAVSGAPVMPDLSERAFRVGLGLALALGAVLWVAFQRGTGIVLEDALITFRFAGNLAEGRGFAFNPGEPVLGTTTPLFTLLLAALGRLVGVGAIPDMARCVLLLSGLATILFTTMALVRLRAGRVAALASAFLFALHPDIAWTTAGGMETTFVLFLMAGSLWALSAGREVLAGLLAGLLVLARPDGLVWAGLVLATLVPWRRGQAWRAILAFAAVVGAWGAYALATFGSVVPQTVVAKATTVGPASPLHFLRPIAVRVYATYFAGWLPFPPEGGLSILSFAIGLALALLGGRALVRVSAHPARFLLAVFPFAFAGAYYVGQAPRSFPWYGIPFTWAVLALTGVGLAAAGAFLGNRARAGAGTKGLAIATGSAVVLVLAASLGAGLVRTFAYERAFQENEIAGRRRIGEWIATHTPPDARIAMEAIGYQAYYSRRPVIDLAGLVTPEVTRLRRGARSNAEVYRRIFDDLGPDLIVLRSFEVDTNRHRDGGPFFESDETRTGFARVYKEELRVTVPHPELWAEGASLTVYRRVAPGRMADQTHREGS